MHTNTFILAADDRPPILNKFSVIKTGIYAFLIVMTVLGVAYALFFLVFQAVFRNRK